MNAAGIVISLNNKAPLAGVIVREIYTGLQTITDANGYYKLKIPAKKDSVHVHFDYVRRGYEATSEERFWPVLKQTTGICNVPAMTSPSDTGQKIFMDAPDFITSPMPVDPGYDDAFHALQQVLKANHELNNYIVLKILHPEISLFYLTEDKQKRILVHTDGTAERYGYPGTPSLADMDVKYGALPDFMAKNNQPVNSGYLSRWADISAQAAEEFHPAKGNPKAILFPGDSRVIAVSADGNAQVYDMDNDDPKELPAFEQLYGKLPDCVPQAFHHASQPQPVYHPIINIRPAGKPDSVPRKRDTIVPKSIRHDTFISPTVLLSTSGSAPLYIVDGVMKEKGVGDLNPMDIESITVIKDTAAKAIYGVRGANGVILITTKNAKPHPLQVVLETTDSTGQPLTIIADSIKTPLGTIHAEPKIPIY